MGLIKDIKKRYNERLNKVLLVWQYGPVIRVIDFLIWKRIITMADWEEYVKHLQDSVWLEQKLKDFNKEK